MRMISGPRAADDVVKHAASGAFAVESPSVQKILVSARWEVETVYLIAELIRDGTLPSQKNLDRLELACRRLNNAVKALGGDQEVVA